MRLSMKLFVVLAPGAGRRPRHRRLAVRVARARTAWRRSPTDKGFVEQGTLHALQDDSPIPDYAFPGIEDERLATGVAGFVGTLGVFAIGFGAGLAAAPARRRRRTREAAVGGRAL